MLSNGCDGDTSIVVLRGVPNFNLCLPNSYVRSVTIDFCVAGMVLSQFCHGSTAISQVPVGGMVSWNTGTLLFLPLMALRLRSSAWPKICPLLGTVGMWSSGQIHLLPFGDLIMECARSKKCTHLSAVVPMRSFRWESDEDYSYVHVNMFAYLFTVRNGFFHPFLNRLIWIQITELSSRISRGLPTMSWASEHWVLPGKHPKPWSRNSSLPRHKLNPSFHFPISSQFAGISPIPRTTT